MNIEGDQHGGRDHSTRGLAQGVWVQLWGEGNAYRNHLREVGEAYRRHLGRHYPAMTLAGVKALIEEDQLVEIEGVAVIPLSREEGGSAEREADD